MSVLNKEQLYQFLDYTRSPFFNKRKTLVIFTQHLLKHAPDFPEDVLNKEHLHALLFPDKIYDDKRMRYEMSYLAKMLEDFLALLSYQENPFLRDYHLLDSLNSKKLDKYFLLEYKHVLSRQSSKVTKNAAYYFNLFLLSDLSDKNFSQRRERKFDISIQNASQYLDLFYLSKKLRFCCNMSDRQKIIAKEYQIDFLEEFNHMRTKVNVAEVPDIEMYDQVFNVIDKDVKKDDFLKIISLLKSNAEFLSVEDQEEIYIYLINYCARKIRKGNETFVAIALELYLNGIQSKVLFEDGFLSPWTFKNIISLGLRSSQFEWVKTFIVEYGKSIKKEFRQDALHFNLADLSFHQNEFQKTLDHLNKLEYSDIYYTLNGRVLLLKTYFHLEEIEPLLSGIAAFRIFLKRNKKITKDVKKSYLNFCQLLSQIVKSKSTKNSIILTKIENTQQVISKSWLKTACDFVFKKL